MSRRHIFTSVVNAVGAAYRRSVSAELKRYGLKYDDVLNEALPSVQEAISRLTPEEKVARDRRLKRAIDMSFKKKGMPEDGQNYDPFEDYLFEHQKDVEKRQEERAIGNSYN